MMSNKTKPCYVAVINCFRQITPDLEVLSVTTDFEVGLKSVLRQFYPNAVIKGCYFHYVQVTMHTFNNFNLIQVHIIVLFFLYEKSIKFCRH